MTLKTKNVPIKRWWDIGIALFILAAITLVAARLWVTEWTGDLYILVYLMFFAGLSGIALGVSQFSFLLSFLFSLVYGIFIIGWLFGTTVELEMTWRNRLLYHLGWRLRTAITQFNTGEAVSDPIIFLTIMAILLWFLGSTAAFMLIREGAVWSSIIPLGLTLLIIGHYDQNLALNTGFLMTFLFLALLIVGRMTFLQYQQKWQREGIHITAETNIDLTKTLLILTFVLMVLSWLIPITPTQATHYSQLWETITEPWDNLREELSDLFFVENASSPLSTSYFGDSIGLGTGTPTNEKVVLSVKVETDPPPGYRHYWRGRSYDTFHDSDWTSSPGLSESLLFPDSFEVPHPEWVGEQIAAYTFTSEMNSMINLYTTGTPTWVSHPVEAITHILSDGTQDLIALIAEPALTDGEQYQVETRVSLPTVTQLRQTSTDYPDWIDRYLQLPSNFSPEIENLAAEITAGIYLPYDQAVEITHYLRENIDYSRTIPPVPAGADPIEWFLFDEQTGFCNYYATAEVLMLRSLGIPARISVGYASGDYDRQTDTYTVHKRDRHAWPEVFFMDYGWIIFEPTTSQPAVNLPLGSSYNSQFLWEEWKFPLMDVPIEIPETTPEAILETREENTAEEVESPFDQSTPRVKGSRIIWLIVIAFSSILFLLVIFILLRPTYFKINIQPLPVLLEVALEKMGKTAPGWLKRWSYRARMSAAERAYLQLGHAIKIMGHAITPTETPAERAQILINMIPAAKKAVEEIIHEYHLDIFSDHIINEERARNAARHVRRLAIRARFKKMLPFIYKT